MTRVPTCHPMTRVPTCHPMARVPTCHPMARVPTCHPMARVPTCHPMARVPTCHPMARVPTCHVSQEIAAGDLKIPPLGRNRPNWILATPIPELCNQKVCSAILIPEWPEFGEIWFRSGRNLGKSNTQIDCWLIFFLTYHGTSALRQEHINLLCHLFKGMLTTQPHLEVPTQHNGEISEKNETTDIWHQIGWERTTFKARKINWNEAKICQISPGWVQILEWYDRTRQIYMARHSSKSLKLIIRCSQLTLLRCQAMWKLANNSVATVN